MVVGGCSWLASCCWEVVGGCSWLAEVVICAIDQFVWCFFGNELYMVAISGCWA